MDFYRHLVSRRRLLYTALAPLALEAGQRLPAPEFSLKLLDGKRFNLKDFSGSVVALNFWASWCEPCRTEMPWLNRVHRDQAADGFTAVGLSLDEQGWRAVAPFAGQFGIRYPLGLATPAIVEAYAPVEPLPTTVFLDRRLRIVARHHGLISEQRLRRIIELLLSEERS